MHTLSIMFRGCFAPTNVETLTFRESIKWILQLQLGNVILEMDCKVIVDAFYSQVID